MSKIDLEISIRSSDLVFARINLDFCGSDLFYTRFTLKERKEKVPSILEIWAEGLITFRYLNKHTYRKVNKFVKNMTR